MNVYVVSLVWWRDGATVIGAGVERSDAEMIADRYPLDDHDRVSSWTPWREEVSPSEGSCTWTRQALGPDGSLHRSLSQEIVVVPLASQRHVALVESGSAYPSIETNRAGIADRVSAAEAAGIGRQFGAP